MIYEVWKDYAGKYHIISEMDTQHIRNCIKQIETSIRRYNVRPDEGWETKNDDEFTPLGKEWSEKFANGFLDAFKIELNIRNRIRKKDYPVVDVEKNCETCAEIICKKRTMATNCTQWSPASYALPDFEGEDAEVARRGGIICNGEIYEQDWR